MNNKSTLLIVALIFTIVGIGVTSNINEQLSVDRSRLPEKVEDSKGFQRWLTNAKNKGFDIEADEFVLKEENEVYNTQRVKVYNADTEEAMAQLEDVLAFYAEIEDDVEFSPSERQILDFRSQIRTVGTGEEYHENEVHYYGLRDDKIIDSKILRCDLKANCYYDRGYFLDNNSFVISKVSRNLKRDEEFIPCAKNEVCTYIFTLNVIDLNLNSNLIYVSEPFEAVWDEMIPNL